jgi:hypothetical protein
MVGVPARFVRPSFKGGNTSLQTLHLRPRGRNERILFQF